MLIYGGLKRDELWQYWISSNVWERIVPADGPAPGKRHGQGAVEDPAGDGSGLLRTQLQLTEPAVEVFSLADAKARANANGVGLWARPY